MKTFKLSCKNCKKIFESNGANQKYCDNCNIINYQCEVCGKKYTNKDKQNNNKCCNECWDKLETIYGADRNSFKKKYLGKCSKCGKFLILNHNSNIAKVLCDECRKCEKCGKDHTLEHINYSQICLWQNWESKMLITAPLCKALGFYIPKNQLTTLTNISRVNIFKSISA